VNVVTVVPGYDSLSTTDKLLYHADLRPIVEEAYRDQFPLNVGLAFLFLGDVETRRRRAPRPQRIRRTQNQLVSNVDIRFASVPAATQAFTSTNSATGRATISTITTKAINDAVVTTLVTGLSNASSSSSVVQSVRVRSNDSTSKPDYTVYYVAAGIVVFAIILFAAALLKMRHDRRQAKLEEAILRLEDPDAWFKKYAARKAVTDRGPRGAGHAHPPSADPFGTERGSRPERRTLNDDPFEAAKPPWRGGGGPSPLTVIAEGAVPAPPPIPKIMQDQPERAERRRSSVIAGPPRLTKTVALRRSLHEGVTAGTIQVSPSGQVLKARKQPAADPRALNSSSPVQPVRRGRRSSTFMLRQRALEHLQGKASVPVVARTGSMMDPTAKRKRRSGVAAAPFVKPAASPVRHTMASFSRPSRRDTVTLRDRSPSSPISEV